MEKSEYLHRLKCRNDEADTSAPPRASLTSILDDYFYIGNIILIIQNQYAHTDIYLAHCSAPPRVSAGGNESLEIEESLTTLY